MIPQKKLANHLIFPLFEAVSSNELLIEARDADVFLRSLPSFLHRMGGKTFSSRHKNRHGT